MGVYSVLPQEVKDLIPQFNELTALISGGSTMLIGSGGLVFQAWLTKARVEADGKYSEVANYIITLSDKYSELTNTIRLVEKASKESDQNYAQRLTRIETLLETDLRAKLSNKLIDEEIKSLIEGVLNEEEVDL